MEENNIIFQAFANSGFQVPSEFEANGDLGEYVRIQYRTVTRKKSGHKLTGTETIARLKCLNIQLCESEAKMGSNKGYLYKKKISLQEGHQFKKTCTAYTHIRNAVLSDTLWGRIMSQNFTAKKKKKRNA